jgi:hypothetical protein
MNSASMLVVVLLLSCSSVLFADPVTVDFDSQIIPILTKSGCNSGACHGSAAGRGGFHLSLLGADPSADYHEIVLALEGRRINREKPHRSLLLLKSSEQIEHGGDVALDENSPGAALIAEWIRAGANRGAQRKLIDFEISPRQVLVPTIPATLELKATARFNDGTTEDVSAWTTFTSADAGCVEIHHIDGRPHAQVRCRGQHIVTARFLNKVIAMQLIVPLLDVAVNHREQPRTNFVDDEVLQHLSDLRIPVSPAASDPMWLRRVSLDLTGRLPDVVDLEQFQSHADLRKREQKVDELLKSDAFADYWTLRFSKLLKLHSLPEEKQPLEVYAAWLREQIRNDIPWNEVAYELLTATGDSHQNGPANFSRMVSDPRDQAKLIGQAFLGVRLECANCHNHPLDRWTQDDFHGLAAVFSKLDRTREVRVIARGAVTNLRTGQPAVPRIPGVRDLPETPDPREAFAEWVQRDPERLVARAMVNRLWRSMFGRGLIEPADDLRETVPATHPALLEHLTDDFVKHDYSVRHLLKRLALSNTYGRSHEPVPENGSEDRYYSRAYSRPLEAAVLLDAICDVTAVPEEFPGLAHGTRAVQVIDPGQPAATLDLLGRCSRAMGCDENSGGASNVVIQLHLLNGDLLNAKIALPEGRLHRYLEEGRSDEFIVTDFYKRALSRHPTAPELSSWLGRVSSSDKSERTVKLEDFLWALLSSQEFRNQH